MVPAASDERHDYLAMDFCLWVGELLLSSGAGAADVAETMKSLARHLGLRPVIDVTFISLSMSHQPDPERPPLVQIRQVSERTIDYQDLTQVDHLVRYVLTDQVDLREARGRLARIVASGHHLPRWAATLGWGAMCAGVAIQLGGTREMILIAFVAAVCIDLVQEGLAALRFPAFYRQVAGGVVATILAVAGSALLQVDPSRVVTANIVMLLAGVGFMGAVQDALTGYYITAGARILEAILATTGIIAGVSGGLSVAAVFGAEVGRLDPGRVSLESVAVTALGAALAAAAFALASYAPRRVLLPVAAIAALAMVIHQLVLVPLGRPWAAGTAAFFVGLVTYWVSGRVGAPPLVLVVPAVIPMLPGLLIYRGLSLLADGGESIPAGLLSMVTAASVATALAAGVILGELLAQPIRRRARRLGGHLDMRRASPRLIGALRRAPSRRRAA